MIVKDCKYCKAYDMVPHSWIQKCMEVFGVAVNVRSFVNTSIKQWNTELTAGNQRLGNVKIKCRIFKGDILSPLLFALVMIQLALVLKEKNSGKKINNLLFMNDLKQLAKNEG